jgi:hypothetical protein
MEKRIKYSITKNGSRKMTQFVRLTISSSPMFCFNAGCRDLLGSKLTKLDIYFDKELKEIYVFPNNFGDYKAIDYNGYYAFTACGLVKELNIKRGERYPVLKIPNGIKIIYETED